MIVETAVKKHSAVVQTPGEPPNTGNTRRPESNSRLKSRAAESPIAARYGHADGPVFWAALADDREALGCDDWRRVAERRLDAMA